MKKIQYFIQIGLSILLILSVIQIIPDDVKITQKGSASSTWYQTNWSAPGSYDTYNGITIINNTGDLKLDYGRIIYVADTNNHRIVETMMDGGGWSTYGTQGSGTGQFNKPIGIYYDKVARDIYISDALNHRIIKTKMGGTGWTTYGTLGSGVGQFNYTSDIHYDSNTGFLYIADLFNDRIVKTMINGSGWTTFGTQGSGTGQFNRPYGIYYDNNTGYIYVTDSGNNRLVKTMMDGTSWTTYGSFGVGNNKGKFYGLVDISYDKSTNYIYVTDSGNNRLVKTMMDGTGWTSYCPIFSGIYGFNFPMGVCYDSNTYFVYVAGNFNSTIYKTMMNGSGWTTYGSGETRGSGIGQFDFPCGITLGPVAYCSRGFLESKKYNLNGATDILSINWTADTPPDTSVKFQLRTGENESDLSSKSFVGPGGNSTKFYNTSGANVWGGHRGDRWIQYRVNLTTINFSHTPILKDVTIIYNLLPNRPILIAPENNTWTNNNRTTFTWSFNDMDSSSQSGFQWQIDSIIEFNDVFYDSEIVNSAISSYTLNTSIPEGIWYWRVRTKDSDNDWGPYSLPWKILIDTKPPKSTLTLPINNGLYNNLKTIFGTATDPRIGTGINKVEIAIKMISNNNYWNGSNWVPGEVWLMASGTTNWSYNSSFVIWHSGSKYSIISRATDYATNVELPGNGNVFTYDNKSVEYSNAFPPTNYKSSTENVDVGITISDFTSGVNASTIEYIISKDGGKTWSSWTSVLGLEDALEINVAINLTFLNGSNNRIKWRASDIAGNGPSESKAYIVNVNTWQQILHPRVWLRSPPNGSIITTTSVDLSWILESKNLLNVTYDIYLDRVNSLDRNNRSGVLNSSLRINDLINGETYYWTVIPRIGMVNGSCISGVWSFTVDIPNPSVTLISPANSSTISSRTPTLMWSLEYEGTAKVKYEVYFENNIEPKLLHKDYSNTYFSPQTILEYNTIYYWQIVPNASGIKGPPSELWSFTVEQEDYSPHFDLKLELEPAIIELVPDEKKYVKAIVTNLGNLTDMISLRIWVPPDARVGAMVNEPNIMDASPRGIAEFSITVMAFEDAEQNEISLRVVAISETAAEYNLTAVKETTLIVKINIVDMDTEKPEQDNSFSLEGNWYLFFIVIIIILILIVLAIIIIRKKRKNNELPTAESVTVKSEEILVPEIISKEVLTTSALMQPGTATTPAGDTPQLAASPTTTPVPVPKLVKSTQITPESIPQEADSAQVPSHLPQLPPAQVEIQAQVQTPIPAPVVTTLTPQVVQQPQKSEKGEDDSKN